MSELIQRYQNLFDRLGSYSLLEVAFELLVIGIVTWVIVRFVQGTRAAGALKGLLFILVIGTLIVRVLGAGESFQRLSYLYDRMLAIVAIALIVIFQPELRRALIRLGETPFMRSGISDAAFQAEQIAPACRYLAKSRFGALIVIERRFGLKSLVESGVPLGAELSGTLLQTIFYPGSALHDLAVVVRGRKIQAASVQLPMADVSDMPHAQLGSRHRAAVGLTKESDALVVIVSEETGQIRFADRGVLSPPIEPEHLETELKIRLGDSSDDDSEPMAEDEDGLDDTPLDEAEQSHADKSD